MLMDSGYDTSYLEPVEELALDNVLACASGSLFRNVTAFGYGGDEDLCILLNADYYVEHDWTPLPDMEIFLRNRDIHPGTCVHSVCGMCMQVLEVPMTWADSERACGDVSGYLLAVWAEWVHRCILMQLQYLRMRTTNVYWVGGASHLSEASKLWAPGQPNNSGECVLPDSGDHYRLFTADCSEKHHIFCYLPEGDGVNFKLPLSSRVTQCVVSGFNQVNFVQHVHYSRSGLLWTRSPTMTRAELRYKLGPTVGLAGVHA